ncbi:hypothetical protein D3C81_365310 [compost metagenome]
MSKLKNALLLCGAAAAVFAADWLVTGPSEAEITHNEYCEMVQLYKNSKGGLGWPDYKRQYDKLCPKQ